jgi:Bacterial Ig-like domain (group 3)/IPT/TIG domain/Abnormal spindle-like microcephaly-assoc'd, ASPM-SPD-2-Hydin
MFERALRRHVKAALAIATVAVVSLVPAAASATPAAAGPSTVTISYPSVLSYVAPGPGTLTVTAVGGSGGDGAPGPGSNGGAGGYGASVSETFPVNGGEFFTAYPGRAGGSATPVTFSYASGPGVGGYQAANGGYADGVAGAGGGGGGLTEVVDDTTHLPLEVAAGGGGGGGGGAIVGYDGGPGGGYDFTAGAGAGAGGGSAGFGWEVPPSVPGPSASAGTAAGGAGGGGGGYQFSGVSGQPGTAGGGGGGGGNGGLSYGSTARVAQASFGDATSKGDGSVTFTFTPANPTQIAINTVTASPSPAVAGVPVTLTDTVTPYGTGLPVPTGSVEFEEYNTATGASTALGTAAIANGVASLSVPSFTAGTHYVYAAYQGDSTFYADNSAIITLVANPQLTTLAVTPEPVAFGKLTDGLTTTKTITVTNTGNVPWVPSSIGSASSDFSLSAAGVGSASVAPGASYTFAVTFSPTVVGPDNTTITVTSNFPALAINVTATGVALRPPSITSINPSSGTIKGGTTVTVTGTNLTEVTAATVGTKPALSFSCATPASCVVVTPPGSGTVPIRLTNRAGTSTLVPGDRFTYKKP